MSGFVDTSVLVRYLTDDPPELAELAARIVDREDPLFITDVVLAETAYVLTSVYKVPRAAVVDSLVALLRKANIDTSGVDKMVSIQGLLMCRPSGGISFADALLWAAARSRNGVVYSFDARFPTLGIDVRRRA